MKIRLLTSLIRNALKRPFYVFYQQRLTAAARTTWKLPKHIGIILDGNRRYARDQGLSRIIDGHALGANKTTEVLDWCFELNIPVVTIWIFSLDNFNRAQDEVDEIFSLIEEQTRNHLETGTIHKKKARVKYIGKIELLPESLRKAIEEMERSTAHYDQLFLNIAIAYGGREEITDACRQYLSDGIAKGTSTDELLKNLNPDSINSYLYTSGQPDPDLIIRTSGEVRLSGFLLWQSAYSEFYFCDIFWPAFRKIDFLRAIREYNIRQRRYGR